MADLQGLIGELEIFEDGHAHQFFLGLFEGVDVPHKAFAFFRSSHGKPFRVVFEAYPALFQKTIRFMNAYVVTGTFLLCDFHFELKLPRGHDFDTLLLAALVAHQHPEAGGMSVDLFGELHVPEVGEEIAEGLDGGVQPSLEEGVEEEVEVKLQLASVVCPLLFGLWALLQQLLLFVCCDVTLQIRVLLVLESVFCNLPLQFPHDFQHAAGLNNSNMLTQAHLPDSSADHCQMPQRKVLFRISQVFYYNLRQYFLSILYEHLLSCHLPYLGLLFFDIECQSCEFF